MANVGCEIKKGIKDHFKVFDLTSKKMELPFTDKSKPEERTGEDQELHFGHVKLGLPV